MSRALPASVAPYAQIGPYTCDTAPGKLLAEHSLKAGVYGVIAVRQGVVRYFLGEATQLEAAVSAGGSFIILPTEAHYIRPSPDAVFTITLLR
ncbi:MAG: DUF1971 domain-containing protein [Neomegalonema sp.]|nr:DUF1971 domain-containing protein [Neomegalonema sp.]